MSERERQRNREGGREAEEQRERVCVCVCVCACVREGGRERSIRRKGIRESISIKCVSLLSLRCKGHPDHSMIDTEARHILGALHG